MKPYLTSEHIKHNLANLPRLVFDHLMTYILGIFCLLYACALSAQPKNNIVTQPTARIHAKYAVIDHADLRVSYALNADNLLDISTYVDLQYLEVGRQTSKYYSALLAASDSLSVYWVREHPNVDGPPRWTGEKGKSEWWSEYQYTEIFRSGGEQTMYSRMPFMLERYDCWHTEPYPQQSWQLQSDTLTICGYLCQKAVCSFRGRDFEAWFAPQIPVREGPWTFGGLPGLILKVYDKDRLYVFECVGIERGNFPIKKLDYSKYKPVKRKELLKMQRKINEDYFSFFGGVIDDATGKPLRMFKPYEPLELE